MMPNLRLVLSFAVGLCLVTTKTQAADKQLPLPGETFTVDGHQAFVIVPDKPADPAAIPWVWYAPTLPGLPAKSEVWMFEQFLESGIAIAGIDVGESFGSPEGRRLYSALYRELVDNRRFAPKASLLARSRGGLMLYCWAAENPKKVNGIAGIYPVCNIASYPGIDRACSAYGFTSEQLRSELTKHNPIDRLAPLADAGVPIFHIHGDVDKVVPLELNSGMVAKRYDDLGGKMDLEVVKGQGHNMWPGWFQSQRLVDFVIRSATGSSTQKK